MTETPPERSIAARARELGRRLASLPLALLGMLAIVVAFESYLAAHPYDFTDMSATDWRLSRKAATDEALKADVLLFGDSLLKFGAVPELFERETGLDAFNLSVLGGQAATSYFLLRRTLEAGARPRAVVVDCQDMPAPAGHGLRGLGVRAHIRNWPELLGLRDAIELAVAARDPELLGSLVARMALTSLKARSEVRSGLSRLIRRGATSSRYVAQVQRRNWRLHDGSILMAPKSVAPTRITAEQLATPRSRWADDPVSGEFLRKFVGLATSRSIPVFFLIPPTSPEHEGLRERVGQHLYYTELARGLQDEFPGVVVIDGRDSSYARRVFIDDSHLDRLGAVRYTNDVVEAMLATRVDGRFGAVGPRWFVLPAYRDGPDAGPLEDFDGSRMALDTKGRPRR